MKKDLEKQFHCAICNTVCGEINLRIEIKLNELKNEVERHILEIDSFQKAYYPISKSEYDSLLRHFTLNKFDKIFSMNKEWVPFYCEICTSNFCIDHWKRTISFDEGFYDAEHGICPNGHKRMLYD